MKVRYYQTSSGRSPVEEFLLNLHQPTRLEITDAIILLEAGHNLSMPLSRNLSNVSRGLHELRFRDKGGQVRVVYFIKKGIAIYLIHGFRKKTQAIPQKELDLILKRLREI
mgnify:CR=1 FL=1